MINISLVNRTFFRLNTPKYASTPTSGAGAAKHGGRLNRPGIDALYLSSEPETAIAEFRQVSPILKPGTLVSYAITLSKVVDFTGGYTVHWDPLWQDFNCDWRRLAFNAHSEPPTWVLADMVMEAGGQGVLFPSIAHPGGINLVVYNAMLGAGDRLDALDPDGDLPRDQVSWEVPLPPPARR